MKSKKTTYLITGVTGLLGSNFLYEVINSNISNLDEISIVILGRNNNKELKIRVEEQYFNNNYLTFNKDYSALISDFFSNNIFYINTDLHKSDLGISSANLTYLTKIEIDVFFHIAALTDLRLDKNTEEQVMLINYLGTKAIINLIKKLKVKEFCYVSTAYASGSKTGLVKPDYINEKETFNNAYERSKLLGELETLDFHNKTGIKYRIFRTSVLSGRLIDGNLGAVNKYDVFYQIAVFLLRIKLKRIKDIKNIYNKVLALDLRMYFNHDGSLNIVPVDYVAKMMNIIVVENHPEKHFNLVNDVPTANNFFMPTIVKAINIKGIQYVNSTPENLNMIERVYYKHCGEIFEPYLSYTSKEFDCSNLNLFKNKYNIKCPPINVENLDLLLKYGMERNFSLF